MSLCASVSSFWQMARIMISTLLGVLGILNELIHIKHLKWSQAHSKYSINLLLLHFLNSLIPINLQNTYLDLAFPSAYTLFTAKLLQKLTFTVCPYSINSKSISHLILPFRHSCLFNSSNICYTPNKCMGLPVLGSGVGGFQDTYLTICNYLSSS